MHAVPMPAQREVTDDDMPQLFRAADRASLNAQRGFVNGTRLRLVLVILAAASGLVSWRVGSGEVDVFGLSGVVFFVGALLVESSLWKGRPDKSWYDARAVAESAKTLAWKFAVCAEPFPSGLSTQQAQSQLVSKLETVRERYTNLDLDPVETKAVSDWMRDQRSESWTARRAVYLEQRVRSQRRWYATKAKYNKKRSKQWRAALVALEFVGATVALVEAVNKDFPSLGPFIAAIVGSFVAWVETKQHDTNARAYSAAVNDLANAESKLEVSPDEDAWALEVNDAEDAISREHTLWLASRSQL